MGKRAFDIVVSTIGLIVLGSLMLAMALWVKLDPGGAVFFRGTRVGRGGHSRPEARPDRLIGARIR